MRWLYALVAASLVIAGGWVAFLNPGDVEVRLAPGQTTTAPLAGALLAAFAAGGLLVGLTTAVRASARGWQAWREQRRVRRERRRAESLGRGRDLLWAGEYARARAELLRAERELPDDARRIELLAETHLREGDAAEARSVLEQALGRGGADAHLLDLLATAAERTSDLGGAVAALERARLERPGSPRLARRLRDLYVRAGRWPDAVALQAESLLQVRRTPALAEEETLLRGIRYQAALADAEPRRAARLLIALAREDPRFVPAWVSAGDRLVAAGRPLAARRIWERGARHHPAAVLLERIEQLNATERRPERTARIFRRLGRRHPDAGAVPLLLARHLIVQSALEEAAEVLSTVPAPLSGHPLVHTLWGELHRRRGNHTLAADTFARALAPDLGVAAPFRCTGCRRPADAWEAYCAGCGRWGTFRARVERAADAARA
jgi:tetratricopeptide (TPR) repeat protein